MQHTPFLEPLLLAREVIQPLYQKLVSHRKERRDVSGRDKYAKYCVQKCLQPDVSYGKEDSSCNQMMKDEFCIQH